LPDDLPRHHRKRLPQPQLRVRPHPRTWREHSSSAVAAAAGFGLRHLLDMTYLLAYALVVIPVVVLVGTGFPV